MKSVRALAVAAVVLVVFAYAFAKLTDDDKGAVTARQPHGQGLAAVTISTATKVRLSPDGTRLAIVEGGQVTVARADDARVVSRVGSNVVDAAWMPDGERLLLTEGPIPTGQLSVVDRKGAVAGVAQLSPSIGFGYGLGAAVNARGTQAAVIAVTRDPIGGRQHSDLAVVGLQTGAVRVFATPGSDEVQPLFVDDDLVAVASQDSSGKQILQLVDLDSGDARAGPALEQGPFVRTFGGEVVIGRRAPRGAVSLVAVNSQTLRRRALHVTEPWRRVMAVDFLVTRALVRVPDAEGEAHLEFEAFAD